MQVIIKTYLNCYDVIPTVMEKEWLDPSTPTLMEEREWLDPMACGLCQKCRKEYKCMGLVIGINGIGRDRLISLILREIHLKAHSTSANNAYVIKLKTLLDVFHDYISLL